MLIGYARISTPLQSLEQQEAALRAAGCEKVFTDVASGVKVQRPGFAAALDQLRAGDTFVVWKLDRAGRSMRHLLLEFLPELQTRGVHLRSLTEGIDTSTPHGLLVYSMAAWMAELEREANRERTQLRLSALRARGRSGGRRAKLSEDDLALARKLLSDTDVTVGQVAKRFGVGRTTLYRSLGKGGNSRARLLGLVSPPEGGV